MKGPKIDPMVFWPSFLVLLAVTIPLALNPEAGGAVVNRMLGFINYNLDWLFLVGTLLVFVFLVWLALGRYGNVKLGGPDDEPEFSNFSWIAMLFCAGIGSSLLYWSIIEPMYYLLWPPFGAESLSAEAADWAVTYGAFHWGFSAWAIYCIPTLPIAYAYYVRQIPLRRVSAVVGNVLGPKHTNGLLGKAVDVLIIFGIIGGVSTSLGLGTPMLSAAIAAVFNIEETMGLRIVIVLIWTLIFSTSVYFGLYRGIRRLSDINAYLVLALAAFVLVVGPTAFILSNSANSMGVLLSNFTRMSLWTDPVIKSGFPQDWTVFYWAWWVAYALMMGLFVARISKGRTIRELIFAELIWGFLGCFMFFGIFGSYSVYLELNGIVPVTAILSEQGAPAAIVAVLQSLPASQIVLPIFVMVAFVFLATTLDSSAYVVASCSTKELKGNEEPALWNRVLWSLMLAGVALSLMAVGGLSAVQVSSVVVAVPLLAVFALLIISLMKYLKEDYPDLEQKKLIAVRFKEKQ